LDPQLVSALRDWLADDVRREAARLSSGYQGATYLYEGESEGHPVRLVVKRAADGWFAGRFHRRMLRREARAYQLMANVNGVPHSPGFIDEQWLVLEYIDGEPLKTKRFELRDREAFFARLLQVIHDIHAAGVSHGDLKRKDNILVTADECPVIIDFGAAVMRDGSLWDRLMFRLVRRFDYHAWIKTKYHNDYAKISPDDEQWYRPTLLERAFRRLQKLWRVVSLRQWRKRRRRARENQEISDR
ncbi:MAG: hypothetical protein HKN56_05050, partial [Gammaproteobacteria bacterium]|nr:hypothetical protein [Gammaproteobacteria bacterium]